MTQRPQRYTLFPYTTLFRSLTRNIGKSVGNWIDKFAINIIVCSHKIYIQDVAVVVSVFGFERQRIVSVELHRNNEIAFGQSVVSERGQLYVFIVIKRTYRPISFSVRIIVSVLWKTRLIGRRHRKTLKIFIDSCIENHIIVSDCGRFSVAELV